MSLKRSRCEGVGAAAAPCGPLLHHSRRSSRKRPRKTEPEASHKRQASSTGRGARAAAAAEVAPSVPNTVEPQAPEGPKDRRPAACQWIQAGFVRCCLCRSQRKEIDAKSSKGILDNHFRRRHKGCTPSGCPPGHELLPYLCRPRNCLALPSLLARHFA